MPQRITDEVFDRLLDAIGIGDDLVGVRVDMNAGPNTQASCRSAGTMTLVQNGQGFSGGAQRTFNACETQGGQTFVQPGVVFQIADGRITGNSARFAWNDALVRPCPYQAVIAARQGDTATELTGGGHCVLPGHPRSESPLELDPPPGGTTNAVSWRAVRP